MTNDNTTTYTFTFTSRETYLAFRRDWKADYRETSAEIRRLKRLIAQSFKDGEYAGYHQNELRDHQNTARDALEYLKAAKEEAQRQYLAERASKAA